MKWMGRDTAVAAAWLTLGLILIAVGLYPLWPDVALFPASTGSAVAALFALAVVALFRSRTPLLALGAGTPLVIADVLHGGTPGAVLVFTDLIYAAVKYASDRGLRRVLQVALAAAAGYLLALMFIPAGAQVYQVSAQWLLIVAISAMWGWNVRSERVRTRASLQTEHRQHRADLQERIAHDLHDLVANHIAVAGLHIEAAKLLAAQPRIDGERLHETLTKAKSGTDHAHTELRNLISVLTEEPGPGVGDRPGAATFGHLIPLDREIRWRPSRSALDNLMAAFEPLPAGVLTRVIAEALANAVKHGSGPIEVNIEPAHVRISNLIAPGPAASGTGTGLIGAKKLLAGIGGTLTAIPTRHDVWVTTILLPARSDDDR